MVQWIFISSVNRFRMSDWLKVNECVDFVQRNNVQVGDIVYLYITAPIKRIEYKMIVEKINIPYDEMIDDSEYSLITTNERQVGKTKMYLRLRLLKQVSTSNLHLDNLRMYGLESSMQAPFRINGELLDYIESQFY